MTLREQILAVEDRKTTVVHVPQWDMNVHVRALSGAARAKIKALWYEMIGPDGKPTGSPPDIVPVTLQLGVVDPEGKPVFSSDDVAALMEKNGDALELLYKAINRLSGLSLEAEADAAKK